MSSKFKKALLSLFAPLILLAVTACPGFINDNIQVSFSGGLAKVSATGTFTCISPITGDVISYRWSFGDGATAEGQTVTHSYASSGEFLVECRVLTSTSVLTFSRSITIAPDLQIVYTCDDGDGDICIANADGSGTRLNLSNTVGGDTGGDRNPQWSPDGSQIAYRCFDGDEDICIANADGSGSRLNLSDTVGGDNVSDLNPQWSPDGSQIVYHCRDGDEDICIANADGSGTRLNLSDTVGGDTGSDSEPQWSPDGSQIVYLCRDGDEDICIANADGSGTRFNLSDTVGGDTGFDGEPQWSP